MVVSLNGADGPWCGSGSWRKTFCLDDFLWLSLEFLAAFAGSANGWNITRASTTEFASLATFGVKFHVTVSGWLSVLSHYAF